MNFAPASSHRQSNFGLSFTVLPLKEKHAIQQVYALCRAMDDVSDEPGPAEEKRKRLEEWRMEISRCYTGNP
ncbi:MAG TPA: squalene/phytoene synthase family protein, partial [Nitrospiria bacterium]|nr:squalene/phytoene synthase family protein [Nitrospiria bacterium]